MGGSSLFFLRLLRLALLQDEVNGAIGLTLAEAQAALGLHHAEQLELCTCETTATSSSSRHSPAHT